MCIMRGKWEGIEVSTDTRVTDALFSRSFSSSTVYINLWSRESCKAKRRVNAVSLLTKHYLVPTIIGWRSFTNNRLIVIKFLSRREPWLTNYCPNLRWKWLFRTRQALQFRLQPRKILNISHKVNYYNSVSLLVHRASCRFTKYHTTNKCTNCMSFILNHSFKTLFL